MARELRVLCCQHVCVLQSGEGKSPSNASGGMLAVFEGNEQGHSKHTLVARAWPACKPCLRPLPDSLALCTEVVFASFLRDEGSLVLRLVNYRRMSPGDVRSAANTPPVHLCFSYTAAMFSLT